MATIKAFKALRPKKEFASQIAALPYDVFNTEEAREEINKNQLSFLKVDLPLASLEKIKDYTDKEINQKAKENLDQMLDQGYFYQEDENCLYLYNLNFRGKDQTGLIASCSIDEYINDTIKKHEKTLLAKQKDRTEHIDILDANTGPIFLTYSSNDKIKNLIAGLKKSDPEIEFTSPDGVKHSIWTIRDQEIIKNLVEEFEKINNFYIADGHHRSASAVQVAKKRRLENPNYKGEEEFNYFLSMLVDKDEIQIYDYNRLVKDLSNLSEEEFLEKLKEDFKLEKLDKIYKPSKKGEFTLFIGNSHYKMTYKNKRQGLVENLDVSILQDLVLDKILGIKDPRKDKRIDFVGGIRGLDELERRVHKDMAIAFALYPTSLDELIQIADQNKNMPPKSTWFEPKPRSGLFIHKLK